MSKEEELRKAVNVLDKAWKQFMEHPAHLNEAAYDQAYAQWKNIAQSGRKRGRGRRPGGESKALTSTLRAQAVRDRQKQGAQKWEKVVGLIQQLREEIRTQDKRTLPAAVRNLVHSTEIVLENLEIIHVQPDADFVVVSCKHEKQPILTFIPKADLEKYYAEILQMPKQLSLKDANLIVDNNMKLFARIISEKYERSEHRPYQRYSKTYPRVDITFKDMAALNEKISPDVLKARQTFLL